MESAEVGKVELTPHQVIEVVQRGTLQAACLMAHKEIGTYMQIHI